MIIHICLIIITISLILIIVGIQAQLLRERIVDPKIENIHNMIYDLKKDQEKTNLLLSEILSEIKSLFGMQKITNESLREILTKKYL